MSAEPIDSLCLCKPVLAEQVYSCIHQKQDRICKSSFGTGSKLNARHVRASFSLAPPHLQNAVAWGVEDCRGLDGKEGPLFTSLGMCQSDSTFLSPLEQSSSHLVEPCGLQPLCHWVDKRYEESGALPHQAGYNGRGLKRVIKVRA